MSILLFSLLIIIVDQLSKLTVRANLIEYQKINIFGEKLYLTFIRNRGAAFGILKGQRLFFIIITFVFLIFIIYLYQKELSQDIFSKIAVIFLTGGSLSNLIDRIFLHYVTDFIGLDILSFYKLPVINIADIFIFCGVVLLIYYLLFSADRGV